MVTSPGHGGGQPTGQSPASPTKTKRARWATRKLTVKSSKVKRLSLLHRHQKSLSTEKKRASGGSESLRQNEDTTDAEEKDQPEDQHGPGPRTLYFGQPLPDDLKDEDGEPIQTYARNKIRTAKYTPLSFVPKNLYFQFHNIANVFFLFLIILQVSCLLFAPSCLGNLLISVT